MVFEKIFVVGFNKTATSTFHILFEENGLTSQHDGSGWDVDDYQCFSDNGNLRDWRQYAIDCPTSVFVLNVRPLDGWIRSRAKHCYAEQLGWGYPPLRWRYKKWIQERNRHHMQLLRFFRKQPERLIIVDITQETWLEFVCRKLQLEPHDILINQARGNVPQIYIDEVNTCLLAAYDVLEVPQAERNASFVTRSLLGEQAATRLDGLIDLYANNLELS